MTKTIPNDSSSMADAIARSPHGVVRGRTTYDLLAEEYYSASHRTSRNFDLASAASFRAAPPAFPLQGLILEVGAGRGRVNEFLGIPGKRVVQLDNSREMLSLPEREECVVRVLHQAEELPFLNGAFAGVVGFLCDPFLGTPFLSEAARVLTEGGKLLLTTPAYEWGAALRKGLALDLATTRFITKHGVLSAPSRLWPKEDLRAIVAQAGFDASSVSVQSIRLPPTAKDVSPDISAPAKTLGVAAHELDIVYRIEATGRGS